MVSVGLRCLRLSPVVSGGLLWSPVDSGGLRLSPVVSGGPQWSPWVSVVSVVSGGLRGSP